MARNTSDKRFDGDLSVMSSNMFRRKFGPRGLIMMC